MSVLRQIKTDWLSRGVPAALLLVIVAGQPWLDLDSWIYPFLDRYGLPRPSTIIRYLVVPALILWCFYRFDRHRGRTLAVGGVSAAVLTVYFFFHHQLAAQAAGLLNLTENFRYSLFQEAMYCLTLLLPYGLIYFFVHVRFAPRVFRQVCAVLSASVSLPIVISDLFVFGQSTYLGMTQANFLSWFSGLGETVEPRQLSCKFFFIEGNTIGIAAVHAAAAVVFLFCRQSGTEGKTGLGRADRDAESGDADAVHPGGGFGNCPDSRRFCRYCSAGCAGAASWLCEQSRAGAVRGSRTELSCHPALDPRHWQSARGCAEQ